MSDKKTWIIPVEWSVYSDVQVKADTLEEAIKKFNEKIDDIPLPTEWDYMCDSFRCSDLSIEYLERAQDFKPIGDVVIE